MRVSARSLRNRASAVRLAMNIVGQDDAGAPSASGVGSMSTDAAPRNDGAPVEIDHSILENVGTAPLDDSNPALWACRPEIRRGARCAKPLVSAYISTTMGCSWTTSAMQSSYRPQPCAAVLRCTQTPESRSFCDRPGASSHMPAS